MKTSLKSIIFLSVILTCCVSCDFLETPPSADLDETRVFSDRTLTERFLTGIYAEGVPLGFSMSSSGIDRRLCGSSTLGSACDEAEEGALCL